MALLLRDGYITTISDVTFDITDNQFKGPDGNPTIRPLDYDQFFGLGDGVDDLAYTNFQLGGPVEIWLPIAGDTEIFRAQINGEIGASFGLNVKAVVNPGTVSATLPYELSVSYPETLVFDNVDDDNNIFGLFFASEFENRDVAGFTTDFPSLTFNLDLVAALDVNLSATLGVLGRNATFDILDFDVGTSVPLVSLDTARPASEGGPVEILGADAETLVGQLSGVEIATGKNGEFGLEVEFKEFLKSGKGKQDADVDKKRGDTKSDTQEASEILDAILAGTDVGSLQVFIPNINLVSTFADGVFVTDASRRVDENGDIVDVENYDPNDNVGPAGNRSDLAVLTADLDGIVSYATGFAFPPLEYEFPEVGLDLGPVSFDAAFSYNLFDVELEAALPLEQEFTLTPQMQTRLKFFEANADGSGPELDADGEPIAKQVQVAQIVKQLVFVESGAIRSDAVEQRLRAISEESLTAAEDNSVAADLALFVDFDAGIPADFKGVPAGFTGETASIGGRLAIRENDQGRWVPLVNGDILLQSAPALGEDQQEELSLDGLQLAYQIERDDLPGNVFEYIPVTLEEAQGALRLAEKEMFDAISETPYLTDLNALNLVYDNQRTYVEVEHKAAPIVTNRLGLEFDLSLLLEGLAASAAFSASVDLGLITVSAGVDFDIGPLFSERLPLFNAELLDLYNQTFAIEEIAKNSVSGFTIGEDAGETDFGDAIVGTSGNDVLGDPDDTAQVIVGLAGDDLLRGNGDDTLFGGLGDDQIFGGSSPRDYDTAVFTDLPFALNSGIAPELTQDMRIGVRVTDAQSFEGTRQTITHYATGDIDTVTAVEHLRLTDYADYVNLDGLGLDSRTLDQVDTLGGDDVIRLRINDQFNLLSGLRINAGDGDDLVDYASTNLLRDTVIDGGDGIDEIRIDTNFDLSTGIGSDGVRIVNFENVFLSSTATSPGRTIKGDDNDNVITGGFQSDVLIGGAGDDVLYGSTHARDWSGVEDYSGDTFIGGAGADEFRGYWGIDTVDYSGSTTSVFIENNIGYRGEAQGDRLYAIDRIIGSDFNDILIGDIQTSALEGGKGDDRLMAKYFIFSSPVLSGGAGNDLLSNDINDMRVNQNRYEGGSGFDFLSIAVSDPVQRVDPGFATGKAQFKYQTNAVFGIDPQQNSPIRDVTVEFTYKTANHVEIQLDETGGGWVNYFTQYAEGSARAISYSGTGYFARSAALGSFVEDTIAYDNPLSNWTFERLEGAPFSFPPLNEERASGAVRYTATIIDSGDPAEALREDFEDRQATERFTGIEGVIGSQGNDKLMGNNANNALYGSGGNDLIEGGGGDDLLGFGAVQAVSDVFSFPGGTGGGPQAPGGGSSSFWSTSLALQLNQFDPERQLVLPSNASHMYSAPVGTLQINSAGDTVEVGSLLWGQAGNDTLDMRFDRGLDFFPDRSDNYAWVDLNVAPSNAPINSSTGEQVQYGRAEWRDASGDEISLATTYGIENVIGSRNDDRIIGDRNDNIIEGMGGADIMEGGEGFDTLSYALADEGIVIRLFTNGVGFAKLTDEDTYGNGAARGDRASGFEALRGTDFDDDVFFGNRLPILPKFVDFESTFFRYRVVDPYETDRPIEITLGAGDDSATIFSIGLHSFDMGAGNDTVMLVDGMGTTADLGTGDDLVQVAAGTAQYLNTVDEAYRTNTILGGDGIDTVQFNTAIDALRFENGQWIAEMAPDIIVFNIADNFVDDGDPASEAETAAVNEAFGGTKRYVLEDVEAIVIDGQTMRLDSQDPIMGGDFTLTMDEDARDPIPLNVTVPADEADATYLVLTLPFGADVVDGDGTALVVDQVISAAQLAGLTALPGQDYGQGPGVFIYDRLNDDDAPPRTVNVLSLPQQQGIALNLDVPVDPLGGTLIFTVTEVPPITEPSDETDETDEPEVPGFGDVFVGDRVIKSGDTLSAEEVALLRYIPEQNATGIVGQFTLQADTGTGLRAFDGFDIDPVTLAAQDGIATQTVTFDITPQDDAPDVSRLLFPISPEGELRATVSTNDPEGDDVTLSVVDAPEFGTLSLQEDGRFTYVQDGEITFNESGFVDDFFTVEAVQGNGLSSGVKTQTIRIIAPEFLDPIVFDESRREVFFDETGAPIALGGLGTNDIIVGHGGADRLFGFGGNDMLQGGEGDDELNGGDGDDTLEGGMGANRHELGRGEDMVKGSAAELDGDRIVDFEQGDGVFIAGLVAGAGQVSVSPFVGPTPFFATANSATTAIDAGSAASRDDGLPEMTRFAVDTDGDGTPDMGFQMDGGYDGQTFEVLGVEGGTMIRLAEQETSQLSNSPERFITLDAAPNRVFGGDGDDVILTAGGADILSGGKGNDVMNAAAGDDILMGGRGFDEMTGGAGADLFVINASDYIPGEIQANAITDFTPGEDTIQLGGFDALSPDALTFTTVLTGIAFNVGVGHFVVLEGLVEDDLQEGDIVVSQMEQTYELVSVRTIHNLTAGDDRFFTEDGGPNIVRGGLGDDVIVGDAGADELWGDEGEDLIIGGLGDDRIIGGEGVDRMRGDAGADVFVFARSDSPAEVFTADVIEDFEIGRDIIELQGFDPSLAPSLKRETDAGIAVDIAPNYLLVLENVTVQEFADNADQMFAFA